MLASLGLGPLPEIYREPVPAAPLLSAAVARDQEKPAHGAKCVGGRHVVLGAQASRPHAAGTAALAAMEIPLHLDATCEHGKGGLFVCMDGWRGWVLTVTRIPSEHEDYCRPWVEKTAVLFGDPIATVRDIGEGVGQGSGTATARGVPDFICHYHFLGAVGKKFS